MCWRPPSPTDIQIQFMGVLAHAVFIEPTVKYHSPNDYTKEEQQSNSPLFITLEWRYTVIKFHKINTINPWSMINSSS